MSLNFISDEREIPMSKQKNALLEVIRNSEGHLTAEELFMRCREQHVDISMATVYRNLGILSMEGAVKRIAVPGEPDRYDKTLSPHEHVVCDRCKRMADICMSDMRQMLEQWVGSPISSYDLCVRYVCPSCRACERT